MIKFAIYGLSGSGKSTHAKLMQEYLETKNYKTEIIKLAEPLYKIQKIFYDTAGKGIGYYEQDQLLLETIAENLRKISKTALIDDFVGRLSQSKADVIINDDIRDYKYDYPILKRERFIFIKILCDEVIRKQRLMSRGNLTTTINSKTTSDIEQFESDWVIDTSCKDINENKSIIIDIINYYRTIHNNL